MNESFPDNCSSGNYQVRGKRKVTLVTWNASFGGIEKIIVDYLTYLNNAFDFTVYVLRRGKTHVNLFSKYTGKFYWGHRNTMMLYCKFLIYALKNKEQLFHLFNTGPIVLLILRLAAVKRIIYHIHGTVYWKNNSEKKAWKVLWFLALYKSGKTGLDFLANSEFSKQKFLEQISPSVHIEVLYNPFDVSRFAPIRGQAKFQGFAIVYVGRLVKGKNLFLWLDAAEYILKFFPNSTFRMVGDGDLKYELLNRIQAKGLEKVIRITGYTDNIETVYQTNDLLLFLSEYESFGNVAVESILSGTPVIAAAIPSLKEIFKNYPQFLVEPGNRFFDSLIDRLNHYDSLAESVTHARQDFIRTFNLEKHLNMVKTFYNYDISRQN